MAYFHDNIHSESGKNLFAIRDPHRPAARHTRPGGAQADRLGRTLEKAYRLETTSSFLSIYPGHRYR